MELCNYVISVVLRLGTSREIKRNVDQTAHCQFIIIIANDYDGVLYFRNSVES